MSLLSRINEDLKKSFKEGNTSRVGVLRFILSELHNREIEKRSKGNSELTDEDVMSVLSKEVKKRSEAIELFKKGGREDLVSKEEGDLLIIREYLPPPATKEEIESFVAELKSGGITDFNCLIKETMRKFAGRADGKLVSEIINELS